MAIYHCELKNGEKSTNTRGDKSLNHFLYISREEKYSNRLDLIYKEDINFDKLNFSSKEFWKKSEDLGVVAINYRPYKEFQISLPKELTDEENIQLIKKAIIFLHLIAPLNSIIMSY